jgi:Tfp pilus assembly protein PilO
MVTAQSLNWLRRGAHGAGAALALVIVVAGWLHAAWFSAQTAKAHEQIETAASCIAQQAEIQKRWTEASTELQAVTHEANRLGGMLSDGPEESPLIAALAQLSKESNLDIHSFRPGRKTEHEAVGGLELRLTCSGTYTSLCAFLEKLSGLPRLCRIDQLDVSLADESGNNLQVELQFEVLFKTPTKPAEPPKENPHGNK